MTTLNLEPGQMMLVSAKGVAGDKVQLEFAQIIPNSNTNNSITNLLNDSDERFNRQKPRYAWKTGTKADSARLFNIPSLASIKEGEEITIEMLNPKINGLPLNICILETTKGSEYDMANLDKRAKRAGKDGPFIYHNGLNIFTNTDVVTGEPKHVLLEMDRVEVSVSQVAANAIEQALKQGE